MKRRLFLIIAVFVAVSASSQQHPNQEKGFNANSVYYLGDIDSINAFNGNLTLTIPIGQEYPIGAGLSYRLTLVSNWNVWDSERDDDPGYEPYGPTGLTPEPNAEGLCHEEDGRTVAHPHRRANAGLGWILTLGRLYPPTDLTVDGWTYESPDGADHRFVIDATGTGHTFDGSHLRMRLVGTNRIIEFPDGTIHTFKPPSGPGPWLPIKFANRFAGNWLNIDYKACTAADGCDVLWELTDSHGRTHWVYFDRLTWDGTTRLMVDRVRLQAFTPPGQTQRYADYTFTYSEQVVPRPSWHEVCANVLRNSLVQELTQVTFPDDPSTSDEGATIFKFSYDNSPLLSPGVLSKVVLPTGGEVRWLPTEYVKPQESVGDSVPWFSRSVGVGTRQLWTNGQQKYAEWIYVSVPDGSDDPVFPSPSRELKTTVTDPLGNVTVNYFSIAVRNENGWHRREYGKPFSRYRPDATAARWLSTVVYTSGTTIDPANPLAGAAKATYLRYASDNLSFDIGDDDNWRVESSRVITRDGNANNYVDTDFSNYDGRGHYRSSAVSGSAGVVTKTTFTEYQPNVTDWLLNLYTRSTVTQAAPQQTTKQATVEFCFDTLTGFLQRKRVLRDDTTTGLKDLWTFFTADTSTGNVTRETFFGGDAKPLTSNPQTCAPAMSVPSDAEYVDHAYEYGVRKTSQFSATSFKSLDLTIDKTGLPSSSRDTAGVQTTFSYNPRGQIRELHPTGEAWTEYLYNVDPAQTPSASVQVRRWAENVTSPPPANAVPLTHTVYYYDRFGRLIQQRDRRAGLESPNLWSATRTTYDVLSRVVSTSVPVGMQLSDYEDFITASTSQQYDVLGRVTKVTQPDGKFTTTAYKADGVVARTVEVKTGSTTTSQVTTEEKFDSHGRLVEITEAAGTPSAISTLYEYDEGDRIERVKDASSETSVVQSRAFVYDGAGLLTQETHPESGTTQYQYDARGNVTKRTYADGTVVKFVYDSAGRLLTETHEGLGVLKEYTYDGPSAAGDKNAGKMVTATRHNRHANRGDTVVTETFTYQGPGGRLSSKKTAVSGGPEFVDSYTYDALGKTASITYPSCSFCGSLAAPSRTVSNTFEYGFLREVPGYTSGAPTELIAYHPNGLLRSIRHRNADGTAGPLYTQSVAADGMPRPSAIDVTNYCANLHIQQQPPETKSVEAGQPVNISITASGATSIEWYRLGEPQPIPGQTTSILTVSVTAKTTFWARVKNGSCSVDSIMTTADPCTTTNATITAPPSVNPNTEAEASVASGAASYVWSISAGGTITAGDGTSTVRFKSCAASVTLTVTVRSNCGAESSTSRTVNVTFPAVTVAATPQAIIQGQSATVSASLSGAGPWSIKWSDGSTSLTRTVSPSTTTTYSVTEVNGCAGSFGSVTITVAPPAPTAVVATSLGGTSIRVSWSFAGVADSFVVDRCTSNCAGGGTWTTFAGGTNPFDQTVAADAAYVYRVRAIRASVSSAPSNIDIASSVDFAPIAPGATVLRNDLAQLRTAIQALRVAAGEAATLFSTDDPFPAGRLTIKAVHFTDLQAALHAARARLGLSQLTFTTVTPGETIEDEHVLQLRGGVQ